MASSHTAVYQLNQWDAADPVIRTDFNEDNAKIEAALADLRNLIVSPDILNLILGDIRADITALENRVEALEA